MKRLLETRINFWDLLGGRMSFDIAIYSRVLCHKRTVLFLMLCLVTIFAADPSGVRDYVPLWFSVFVWPVAFALYLGLYYVGFLLAAAVSRVFAGFRVPTPLIGLVALFPVASLCECVAGVLSSGTYPQGTLSLMFYFLSVQGMETVFYRFIMPGVRHEIEQAKAERHLVVGGEKINLRDLHHIKAHEHHVHLTLSDTRKLIRARLGDLVAQTKPEDGLQPHRSWWVARHQVKTHEHSNGRMTLRLHDDTIVPVARTRVDAVQDWLSSHIDGPI